MALNRPTKYPRWADLPTDPIPGTAIPPITEPSESVKNQGWVLEKPSLGVFNWLLNLLYQWIAYQHQSLRRILCLTFYKKSAGSNVHNSMDIDPAGLMVTVGNAGKIYTSTDGTTWTSQTSGTSENLDKVRHNQISGAGGLWVAVGDHGLLLTSEDGETWATGTSPLGNYANYATPLAYGNGVWIIAGLNSSGELGLFWSTDADTWNTVTNPFGTGAGSSIFGACWNEVAGKFFIVGQSTIAHSADGAAWTVSKSYPAGSAGQYLSIKAGPDGVMVIAALAGSGDDAYNLFVTTDGATFSTKKFFGNPSDTNYAHDSVTIDELGMWSVAYNNVIIHSFDTVNWAMEEICDVANVIKAHIYNPVLRFWCFAGSDTYIYRSRAEL